jgi:hypothetical protein
MAGHQILDLYEWASGDCFRCSTPALPTTSLSELGTPDGRCHEVRACRLCVLAMEYERREYANQTGREYVAGRVGKADE